MDDKNKLGSESEPTFSGADLAREMTGSQEPIEAEAEPEVDLEALSMDDPRVIALGDQIQAARAAGHMKEANRLVAQNKIVRAEVLLELQKSHGVYKTPEQLETDRQQTLATIREGLTGDETEAETLQAFGLVDGAGVVKMDSPLFRAETKEAFRQYMKLVTQFRAAAEAEEFNGIRIKDMPRIEADRHVIHDDTSTLVADDLGMDFDMARELVVKMRDMIAPGSGEVSVYSTAVRGAMRQLERTDGHMGDVSGPVRERIHRLVESRHADKQ
jgi:hypothetical protein